MICTNPFPASIEQYCIITTIVFGLDMCQYFNNNSEKQNFLIKQKPG